MLNGVLELALLIAATAGGVIAAIFAAIAAFRAKQSAPLTVALAGQMLRGETDILRAALEAHARGQRQELAGTLNGYQELTLAAFGSFREGVEGQVRSFEAHLTRIAATIEEKVGGIAVQLADNMDLSRSEAHAGRDVLRETIERKLDDSASRLSEATKNLREELGGNFDRLGTRVADSVGEASRFQKERLEDVTKVVSGLTEKLDEAQKSLRAAVEAKLDDSASRLSEASQTLREELGGNFDRLGTRVAESVGEASRFQKERLEEVSKVVSGLTEKLEEAQKDLRSAVEAKLDAIRQENGTKLEEMRQTVDHKLQTTLENRLGESFNRVVEQLERVHKGLGEMQNLASNVGDLKNVLTNVKVRGTYGEVQLELLLEQFLSPEQYVKNAAVRPGSAERVEFAVRFPSEDAPVLLPIDSKFPREDYEHLQEAITAGDTKRIAQHRKDLENRIKSSAREISTKYINPPTTVEYAILFIPTESLYAEVMRLPGLFEQLNRDYRVMIAGPTNLAALLTSFQMGFRALALQKRSSEVWQLLGAIKKEFETYGDAVDKLSRQLNSANNSVENLGKRAKIMSRKLKTVEMIPEHAAAENLLGLDASSAEDESEGGRLETGELGPSVLIRDAV